MKIADINKMTKQEKLEAMEHLWASLVQDESATESPEWHADILQKRKEKIDRGEGVFISIEDLKKHHK